MTGRGRRACAACVVAVLAVGAAGCGDDDEGSNASTSAGSRTNERTANVTFAGSIESGLPVCYPAPKPRDLTIGYANPTDANEVISTGARAMKLETEKLGGQFINLDAKRQPDAQISAIEQLVARKVDGIIVFPIDPKAVAPALKKAEAAGIPVVGLDVNPQQRDPGPLYDSQVLFGRDRMAYLQATEAARLMGAGAKYGEMGFVIPVPTIEAQLARAKFWARKYGLRPVGRANNPSDDIAGGEKAMTQLLSRQPDIDGLVAYTDESATGAAAAVRAQGKERIPLVGVGGGSTGFDSVRAGRIDSTIQQPTVDVGRCAVDGIYDLVEGRTVPRTVVAAEPKVVNKDTVDSVKTWDEQLEERYGKTR